MVVKLMEGIVNSHIIQHFESRNLLSPFQFGFRTREAMTDASWRLVDKLGWALRTYNVVALNLWLAYGISVFTTRLRLKIEIVLWFLRLGHSCVMG